MPKQWEAMLAEYRFTRSDGQPIKAQQKRELDDSLFELIGEWAQAHALAVEGGALFEYQAKGSKDA